MEKTLQETHRLAMGKKSWPAAVAPRPLSRRGRPRSEPKASMAALRTSVKVGKHRDL